MFKSLLLFPLWYLFHNIERIVHFGKYLMHSSELCLDNIDSMNVGSMTKLNMWKVTLT